jgi:hypothetical protein
MLARCHFVTIVGRNPLQKIAPCNFVTVIGRNPLQKFVRCHFLTAVGNNPPSIASTVPFCNSYHKKSPSKGSTVPFCNWCRKKSPSKASRVPFCNCCKKGLKNDYGVRMAPSGMHFYFIWRRLVMYVRTYVSTNTQRGTTIYGRFFLGNPTATTRSKHITSTLFLFGSFKFCKIWSNLPELQSTKRIHWNITCVPSSSSSGI